MSLTSRVTNLFAGSSSAQQDHDELGLKENGLSNERIAFADVASRPLIPKSDTMAQKEVEEEGRPPYLHVGVLHCTCC